MEVKFGRQLRDGLKFTFAPEFQIESTFATRARSSPSTTTRTLTFASPRRSTTSIRRIATGGDLAQRSRRRHAGSSSSRSRPTGASRRRARARSSRRSSTTPRRRVRGNRRAARARRVPARRPAVHGGRARVLTSASRRAGVQDDYSTASDSPPRQSRLDPGGDAERRGRGGGRRADFATIAAWIARGRARARSGLRRRQPPRVPRARARRDAATASRSTTPACARASATAST